MMRIVCFISSLLLVGWKIQSVQAEALTTCSCIACDDAGRRHLDEVMYALADISPDGVESLRFLTIDPSEPCGCYASGDINCQMPTTSTEGECCQVLSPSVSPTTTQIPSAQPSVSPSTTQAPSSSPSDSPTTNSNAPSAVPSGLPSTLPTSGKTSGKRRTKSPSIGKDGKKSTKSPTAGKGGKNSERRVLATPVLENEKDLWMKPHSLNAEIVVADPGIWKIRNFLNEAMLEKLQAVVERAGDGNNLFQRCVGASHQHLDKKTCFRLSGSTAASDADSEFVLDLRNKLNAIWPSSAPQRDYFYVQRTNGGCHPTLVHRDIIEGGTDQPSTATVVLYLSEGGAGTYFPRIQQLITPERGMALTWLNVHADGTYNPNSDHGIQATADDAPDRLVMSYRITLSSEELAIM